MCKIILFSLFALLLLYIYSNENVPKRGVNFEMALHWTKTNLWIDCWWNLQTVHILTCSYNEFFVLKENILCCSQLSVLPMTNITQQIFWFDGLAWKHASAHILFTTSIINLSKKYFLFCDQAWKHYPVYIISQTNCTTNIFVWQLGLKT